MVLTNIDIKIIINYGNYYLPQTMCGKTRKERENTKRQRKKEEKVERGFLAVRWVGWLFLGDGITH